MESLTIKEPQVKTDIHPLIRKRWSALSFSDKMISEEEIEELFEAASWAASAYNEQPWQYVYARRGTEGFEQLWDCLTPGNQPWTKEAAILFVALKRNHFSQNGKVNLWATHDVGMANAQLLLQAAHRDIYGHLMAGYDTEKLAHLLKLGEDVSPVCMGALGFLGEVDQLEASYKNRELSRRSRHAVEKFVKSI